MFVPLEDLDLYVLLATMFSYDGGRRTMLTQG